MDLAIYAYGISIGFLSSILGLASLKFTLKKSKSLVLQWILAGVVAGVLGGGIGGIYFSVDVGSVPGVENPIQLAAFTSCLSGILFTILWGFFRGIFYLILKK
jgi:hypothetical protein